LVEEEKHKIAPKLKNITSNEERRFMKNKFLEEHK